MGDQSLEKSSVSGDREQAPPESASTTWTRRLILFSFWAVIVFLGVPEWLWTTSIHRSSLPLDVMNDWADGKSCLIDYAPRVAFKADSLHESLREALAKQIQEKVNWDRASHHLVVYPHDGAQAEDVDLTVDFSEGDPHKSLSSYAPLLEIRAGLNDQAWVTETIAAELNRLFADERATLTHLLAGTAYSIDGQGAVLTSEVAADLDRRSTRAFKYAATYHLTLSLFTSGSTPSDWDIKAALDQYISPLLNAFEGISNFTVDTQVQLYASYSPAIAGPQYNVAKQKWELQKSDLSGFINAAEWPLSPSIGSGPTINFVIYVPSEDQRPLIVAETDGSSWLVPQWGGMQIFNAKPNTSRLTAEELAPVMLTFAEQLTSLLGLPPLPPSLALRISSLTRERTASLILSASSTLGALARLSLKLTSIAIPDTVAKSVDASVHHLEQACTALKEGRFSIALEHARIADGEAEEAFFEPSMVGQVYFPDEHKVAVYVPLLGPMAVPLVMSVIKEWRMYRQQRKLKTT